MDANSFDDLTVSVIDNDPGGGFEAISINNERPYDTSSEKEVMREVGSALTRLELDIAGCSEKLVNMNLLMMHVAASESNFEAFASEKEDVVVDSVGKALEFDILSGIFDLEVREMDRFIGTLETELNNSREVIFSHRSLEEDLLTLEEKLHDAEKSIKQSQEQVSELVVQSTKFQKILSNINQEETSDEDKEAIISGDGDIFNTTAKLNMLTSQQHRHVLRMLEKSLARELELENELKEWMQSWDEMNHKLHSSQQEILSAEEETAAVYAHFLEADNASAVLMGISKDFGGKLQKAEAESKLLAEANKELNEELNLLKNNGVSVQKVDSLEEQLRERDIQLQEAMALEEASQETQTLLYSSIRDMEILIEKLKSRISEANAKVDNAEDRCITLSESHEELNEELNFLRSKLERLEVSLQQAEETKLTTAKDIKYLSEVITDMVMQLAVERERLHKQLALLMKENRALVDKLRMENKVSSNSTTHEGGETKKGVPSSVHDLLDDVKGNKEVPGATEVEKFPEDLLDHESKFEQQDLDFKLETIKTIDAKLETVRTIDVKRLKFKYVFSACLVVLIGVLALCFIKPENCPF